MELVRFEIKAMVSVAVPPPDPNTIASPTPTFVGSADPKVADDPETTSVLDPPWVTREVLPDATDLKIEVAAYACFVENIKKRTKTNIKKLFFITINTISESTSNLEKTAVYKKIFRH